LNDSNLDTVATLHQRKWLLRHFADADTNRGHKPERRFLKLSQYLEYLSVCTWHNHMYTFTVTHLMPLAPPCLLDPRVHTWHNYMYTFPVTHLMPPPPPLAPPCLLDPRSSQAVEARNLDNLIHRERQSRRFHRHFSLHLFHQAAVREGVAVAIRPGPDVCLPHLVHAWPPLRDLSCLRCKAPCICVWLPSASGSCDQNSGCPETSNSP